MTITGHTGCMGTEANSLASITAAVKNGATIVEFDLNFDKNGTPVLSHDEPKGGEVTLDEAFAFAKQFDSLQINVDVKSTAFLEKVPALAENHGITERIFYTGIFEKDVAAVRQKSPAIPYYINVNVRRLQSKKYLHTLAEKITACGAVGINFNHRKATKKLADIFRKSGLLVSVWTVDDADAMQKMLALCPDNITTRHPDELLRLAKTSPQKQI